MDGEMLVENPKGGRPMMLGRVLVNEGIDVSMIREETAIRYFLGYCVCGEKIGVGHRRAQEVMAMLEKKGIHGRKNTWRDLVIDWLSKKTA